MDYRITQDLGDGVQGEGVNRWNRERGVPPGHEAGAAGLAAFSRVSAKTAGVMVVRMPCDDLAQAIMVGLTGSGFVV